MCYYKVNNKNNNEKRVYMFDVKLFSERLKAARTAKHISQADLAKAVGVSAATISSYETVNGAKIPSLDKATAIAERLGISLDYLCGMPKEGNEPSVAELLSYLITAVRSFGFIVNYKSGGDDGSVILTSSNEILYEFFQDYKKIEPLLDDKTFPEYIRNSLLNPIIEKNKEHSLEEFQNKYPF